MAKSIFSPFQRETFKLVLQNSFICDNFYLSGGTALAEFYLHHRFSEDFDFFTSKKISYHDLRVNLEEIFSDLPVKQVQYRQGLSSRIFFLEGDKKQVVKMEFNYFPFKVLEKGKNIGNLRIDSFLDIAVNKLHAILTRAAARDLVDFYFIQNKRNFGLVFLLKKLEKKFIWKVDPLFLGSCFLKAEELKDYPKIIPPFSQKDFFNFYCLLAQDLKKKILRS